MTTNQNKKACCKECYQKPKRDEIKVCKNIHCFCHSPQEDKPSPDWEIELENLTSDEGGTILEDNHPTDRIKLKSFIRSLLSDTEEKYLK